MLGDYKILLFLFPFIVSVGTALYFIVKAMDGVRKKSGDSTSSLYGARTSDYFNLFNLDDIDDKEEIKYRNLGIIFIIITFVIMIFTAFALKQFAV